MALMYQWFLIKCLTEARYVRNVTFTIQFYARNQSIINPLSVADGLMSNPVQFCKWVPTSQPVETHSHQCQGYTSWHQQIINHLIVLHLLCCVEMFSDVIISIIYMQFFANLFFLKRKNNRIVSRRMFCVRCIRSFAHTHIRLMHLHYIYYK